MYWLWEIFAISVSISQPDTVVIATSKICAISIAISKPRAISKLCAIGIAKFVEAIALFFACFVTYLVFFLPQRAVRLQDLEARRLREPA